MSRGNVVRAVARTVRDYVFLIVMTVWVLSILINLLYVVGLLLSFRYWTAGTGHHPFFTALTLVAVVGCAAFVTLGAASLVRRRPDARERRTAVVILLVIALCGAVSAAPFLIHVAEALVTAQGFAQARYRTDEDYDLTLSNRTDAPVRVCLGEAGDCAPQRNTAAGLSPRGVVVEPGRTHKVKLSAGVYAFTIVDAAPGMSRTDTTVTVDSAGNS